MGQYRGKVLCEFESFLFLTLTGLTGKGELERAVLVHPEKNRFWGVFFEIVGPCHLNHSVGEWIKLDGGVRDTSILNNE